MNELPVQASALLSGVVALLLVYLITPHVREFAQRHEILDKPSERRVHTVPTPRLGGVGLIISVLAALVVTFSVSGVEVTSRLVGILAGALLVGAVGVWDDVKSLKASTKLAFQIAGALIAIAAGVRIDFVSNPFGPQPLYLGWWAWPATLAWLVFITNTINLIDGLDGLAAGVSAIAATTMAFLAVAWQQPAVALVCAALAGAAVGFLRYNFNPAKIFMGDGGAYFLGFVLAGGAVVGPFKTAAFLSILVPILALGVPIADVLFAIVRRVMKRESPFKPDKGHLHHRLLQWGLSHKKAVLVIYAITFVLSLMALLIAQPTPGGG